LVEAPEPINEVLEDLVQEVAEFHHEHSVSLERFVEEATVLLHKLEAVAITSCADTVQVSEPLEEPDAGLDLPLRLLQGFGQE
jgi:hypothetical protein